MRLPPFVLVVSDGVHLRTIHPRAMGRHLPAVEAAVRDLCLDEPPASTGNLQESGPTALGGPQEVLREQAVVQGYTGDSCGTCGNFQMVRNGSCLKCNACGATTGCS